MNIKDLISKNKDDYFQFNEKNRLVINEKREIRFIYRHKLMPLKHLEVKNVKDMSHLFALCDDLNEDISNWDVSNVENMSCMFLSCYNFNKNISGWVVSNVKDVSRMFEGCNDFNQDISGWNIKKEASIYGMFNDCNIKEEYQPKFNIGD